MRTASLALASLMVAVMLGCGGNVKPATPAATSTTATPNGTTPTTPAPTTPTPTTPTPTPTPPTTPTPTPPTPTPPAPPTPTPTTGSNAGMYQVQLVSNEHPQVTVGQVTVDPVSNNGDMNVTLNQVVANTTLFVHFCRFGTTWQDCFQIGSLMTDAAGNASASLKFPKTGTWVGVFYVSPTNWTQYSSSAFWYFTEPASYGGNFNVGQNYRVALVPESTVTGGTGRMVNPATLTGGFVSLNGSNAHVEVHGAQPNMRYAFSFCSNGGYNSSCNNYGAGNILTTDAAGDGTLDMTATPGPSEVFFLQPMLSGGPYITGFVVQ